MRNESSADLLVFGAGPAGLSATIAALSHGMNVQLIEMGSRVEARKRHHADHLVTGVGGAGLYSDGKFSYWPSATSLWQLANQERLRASYDWFRRVTQGVVTPPDFPDLRAANVGSGPVVEKHYPAERSPFESRYEFISSLEDQLRDSLVSGCVVNNLLFEDGGVVASVATPVGLTSMRASGVVLAGGRFGMLRPASLSDAVPSVFRRYEFGVRVVSTARDFPFRASADLDPKLLMADGGAEWRTFCTIRNGEVAGTDFMGLVSYSGRADVAPTNFSNFGFNIRITTAPCTGSDLDVAARRVIRGQIPSFQFGLPEYLSGRVRGFDPAIDDGLRQGLAILLDHLKEAADDLVVIGPCIEGIGYYPRVDSDLRVGSLPVWAAGDTTGLFRGLTPAFVSGYYAGSAAAEMLLI